jgi:hypothetical protein
MVLRPGARESSAPPVSFTRFPAGINQPGTFFHAWGCADALAQWRHIGEMVPEVVVGGLRYSCLGIIFNNLPLVVFFSWGGIAKP